MLEQENMINDSEILFHTENPVYFATRAFFCFTQYYIRVILIVPYPSIQRCHCTVEINTYRSIVLSEYFLTFVVIVYLSD